MSLARFTTQGSIILVGEWQLNIDRQSISDGDNERELEPLLFKLLCYFIEHNERIIPRQELAENIWQQSFVDDNAINRAISELRKILKSTKQPGQSIKTHYRKGYSLFLPLSSNLTEPQTQPVPQEPIITPEVLLTQSTKSIKRTYWPWPVAIILIATIIVSLWFYSEQPSAQSEASTSAPFLSLEAETISWHKGRYFSLLLPPDKSKLTYLLETVEPSKRNDMYVMNLNTRQEYLIDSGSVYTLGWSSDGERLFYLKCSQNSYSSCVQWQASHFKSGEIKKEPMQNSLLNESKLTQYTEIGDIAIFRRNNYRGITRLNALYAYDKNTKEELRITTPNITGTGDYLLTSISNPNRIIFERHNINQSEVYMANLDGSSMKLLTTYSHRAWAATYDENNNSLIWYNRFNSTIESFSLDTMQLEQAIEAPIKAANYAYPLDKQTVLISTDLHDNDVGIFDLNTASMSYIATANKHERNAIALNNGDTYFSARYAHKQEHWLKTNNQFINITDKIGEENKIIAANVNSTQLVSYSKKSDELSVLNATDYSVIKQWKIPEHLHFASIRKNKVAVIYTNASNQQNQLMLFDTKNEETVVSDIDSPLALAWFDDTQLIVHAKQSQFLMLNSLTNTHRKLATPDSLINIKPSIITMVSNDKTLFLATSNEVYSADLDNIQDVKSLLKMKPSDYISQLNAKNDKLAVSFLSTNNPNNIELYSENKPDH